MFNFHADTFKTKTFWGGVLNVIAGALLCYQGNSSAGLILIGLGSTAITGRDSISKLIAAYQQK